MLSPLKSDLENLADPKKALLCSRFFKTGKGEYGEGDVFYGIAVPDQRKLAKKYQSLPLADIEKLIDNRYHEARLIALVILTHRFQKGDERTKKEVYDFYLKHRRQINNWDLVDITAHKVMGHYLLDKDRTILRKLAGSKGLWDRRIAIITTFAFIDRGEFGDTLDLAEMLLHDKHDLIHKAVGWALREVGKKDQTVLEDFLKKHCNTMPRTMLRYAIERLDEARRKAYLKGVDPDRKGTGKRG